MTTFKINLIGTMDWDNEVEEFANQSIEIDLWEIDTLEKFLKKHARRQSKIFGDFDISYEIHDDYSVTVTISTSDEIYFANHHGMTAGGYMGEVVRRFGGYLIRES